MSPRTGARRARSRGWRISAWATRHGEAAVSSLGRLLRAPLASVLTMGVIAVALALPAALVELASGAQAVTAKAYTEADISLFLAAAVDDTAGQALATELATRPEISSAHYVDKAAATAEFREYSGLGDALDLLEVSPLPATILLTLPASVDAPALAATLRTDARVDALSLDRGWIERADALLAAGRRGAIVIGVLLALAVVMIVGNTIRLEIQHRRREIEVEKLIGADDAFIRRPFLYAGLWYGLLGALLGWILCSAALLALAGPVQRLATLYEGSVTVGFPGLQTTAAVLGVGVALGLGGAWLSVARHLRRIQPA